MSLSYIDKFTIEKTIRSFNTLKVFVFFLKANLILYKKKT